MEKMAKIDELTKRFSEARADLRDRLSTLQAETDEVKRRYLRGIRNALVRATDAHDALKLEIAESKALFDKPRTRVLHGVKVGLQKQRGEMTIADEANTIALIRKHFPDQVESLIRSKESVVKAQAAELPAKDLKRIGIEITADTDAVVIKAADTEIDKLLQALLNDDEVAETLQS